MTKSGCIHKNPFSIANPFPVCYTHCMSTPQKIRSIESELLFAQKKLRAVVVKILDEPIDETTPLLMDLLEVSEHINNSVMKIKDVN